MDPIYHLRVFAIGLVPAAVVVAAGYGMTFLPLWLAETPFVLAAIYFSGRLVISVIMRQPCKAPAPPYSGIVVVDEADFTRGEE